ncbi:MAG TPA: hypothetical protein VF101_04965 [Gaiellaceae bacterium]
MATGEGAVAVAGDVVESIIVTGDNAEIRLGFGAPVGAILSLLGLSRRPRKKARKTPLLRRPKPCVDLVDRQSQTAELFAGADAVNVSGVAGVGKTYVLAAALAREEALALPDGVVYLYAKGKRREDLLQALFEEFYDCKPPFKATEAAIRKDLERKRALVVLDSAELERDDLQQLLADVPGCRFVVGSRSRILWDGAGISLTGLELDDALKVVEQELGRPLHEIEAEPARRICVALSGHPLEIRQATAIVREDGSSLADVAAGLPSSGGGSALAKLALDRLTEDQRRILEALAAFGGVAVGAEHVGPIADVADPAADLKALERRRLVESHSPRYSLAGNLVESTGLGDPGDEIFERVVSHFVGWLERTRGRLGAQLVEAEPLLALLRTALRGQRMREAIALGRGLADSFSAARRFGTAAEIHEGVLHAARATKDRAAEAWALHQRGTHAAALHGPDAGAEDLRHARRMREELGDHVGAEASETNLVTAVRAAQPPSPFMRLVYGILRLPLLVAVLVAASVVALPTGTALGVYYGVHHGGGGGGGDGTTPQGILVVVKAGKGQGTVTSDTGAIDCGSACRDTADAGTTVKLVARADQGSRFTGWRGSGCTGTGACTVEIDGNEKVTATFVPVRTALLRVTVTGRGTVTSSPGTLRCRSRCEARFVRGSSVILAAKELAGSKFVGWQDAPGCSSDRTCTVSLHAATVSVRAVFVRPANTQVLKVTVTGAGAGSVVSVPPGIDCGSTCDAPFATGASVTLVPQAADGSQFTGWSGDCTGTGPCNLQMTDTRAVTATFGRASTPTETLTVKIGGNGTGTVESKPTGIKCPAARCSALFPVDTSVTLIQHADPGSTFAGWSREECGDADECTVTVRAGVAPVVATFNAVPQERLHVELTGGHGGRVTSDPPGIDCPDTCDASFPRGSNVTLTAAASSGFTFVEWKTHDAHCPDTSPCSVVMDRPASVGAIFEAGYRVSVKLGDGGDLIYSKPAGITCPATCDHIFPADHILYLSARAKAGYTFSGWLDACKGQRYVCKLAVTGPLSTEATFKATPTSTPPPPPPPPGLILAPWLDFHGLGP